MILSLSELSNNLMHVFLSGKADLGSIHPLVVHFPIALLFVSPLFILLHLLLRKSNKTYLLCAAILMFLGTAFLFLAAYSGDQAAEYITVSPSALSVLENHLLLGEQTRLIFSILSIFLIGYILVITKLKNPLNNRIHVLFWVLFLFFYLFGLFILFNTAHYGGKLVHFHNITTNLYK